MKTTFLSMCVMLLFVAATDAQVRTPAPSPSQKIEQSVGLTTINVEYSRPGVKDREIFGSLVPYGEAWRTGANSATKVTFSTDVNIGGADLVAGTYALLTVPGMESWDFNFYPYTSGNWGSYANGDVEPVVAKSAGVAEMPFSVESFLILFDDLRNASATMFFIWDKTSVALALELPTEAAVMSSIEETMAGPSANDYRAAASYYLAEEKDPAQALEWINMSLEKGGERFWILKDKSLIQANLKDYAGAIETAKRSLELATEADNKDYIKMNNDNIEDWSGM